MLRSTTSASTAFGKEAPSSLGQGPIRAEPEEMSTAIAGPAPLEKKPVKFSNLLREYRAFEEASANSLVKLVLG